MILNGKVWMALPPHLAATWFQEESILRSFLPYSSNLIQTGPGAFDFLIVAETGFVTLKLPGHLTVKPDRDGFQFDASAKHIVGGSATLSLHLVFTEENKGCNLSYNGVLESSGLAARLLRDRADQAQDIIGMRFTAAKAKLQIRYRTAAV